MNNYGNAILEAEQTLKHQIRCDAFDILNLLTLYVEVLDGCNKKFPIQHAHLVEEMADDLAIDLSPIDLEEPERVSKVIKEIDRAHRNANRRYSKLVIDLHRLKDKHKKTSLLKHYISEESFAFYRGLAMQTLYALEIH